MNCANHPDAAVAQYCRTCGKPLCANCTRAVHGVTYCENCLAERLQGTQPPQTAYQQVADQGPGMKVPPAPGSGPNAALAGILGAIPFGVGAVYCGQYVKGLVHLGIFALLVWGEIDSKSDAMSTVLGFGIAFFVFYQIIDAVRTAKAIQMGQPAPDLLGLAQTFGTGEKIDTAKVPTAAVVLIVLGALFLLRTMGGFEFGFQWILPSFLILLGGWLFARRSGVLGVPCKIDLNRCRNQSFVGPTILITLGVLWLVHNVRGVGFFTWVGVLLVVIGLVKILQGSGSGSPQMGGPPPPTGVAGEVQPPSSEVKHG